jgi:hypothetical protein
MKLAAQFLALTTGKRLLGVVAVGPVVCIA